MGRPKKSNPNPEAVRAAAPLTHPGVMDRMLVCNVCNRPAEELRVWQTHDEHDLPIPLPGSAFYLGADDAHTQCRHKLDDHPRLFAEVLGAPGWFPICGSCPRRVGDSCQHPKLKKNGGQGLLLQLRPLVPFGAIICPPPSGPRYRAVGCEGLEP